MKKLVLFLIIAMMPMVVEAQRVDKPGEPYDYFCIVSVEGLYARVSFRKESSNFRNMLDDNGKKISTSKGYIEIFTFMTKRGWEYVERLDKNFYLFKKKVRSDEEAKEFMNFNEEDKGGD